MSIRVVSCKTCKHWEQFCKNESWGFCNKLCESKNACILTSDGNMPTVETKHNFYCSEYEEK